jgi:hypothetical protein
VFVAPQNSCSKRSEGDIDTKNEDCTIHYEVREERVWLSNFRTSQLSFRHISSQH